MSMLYVVKQSTSGWTRRVVADDVCGAGWIYDRKLVDVLGDCKFQRTTLASGDRYRGTFVIDSSDVVCSLTSCTLRVAFSCANGHSLWFGLLCLHTDQPQR